MEKKNIVLWGLASTPLIACILFFACALVFDLVFDLSIDLSLFEFSHTDAIPSYIFRSFFLTQVASLVIAVFSGFVGSYLVFDICFARARQSSKAFYFFLFALLAGIPHIFFGHSYLLLFEPTGFLGRVLGSVGILDSSSSFPQLTGSSYLPALTALILKEIPFFFVILYSAMTPIIKDEVYQALSLGERPFRTFSRIFLPQIKSSLSVSILIVFMFSIGTMEIPILLDGGKQEWLSLQLYQLFFSLDENDRQISQFLRSVLFLETLFIVLLCILVAISRDRSTQLRPEKQ